MLLLFLFFYIFILILLFIYGLHSFILVILSSKKKSSKKKQSESIPVNILKLPIITIQLPIYNEFNMIERLLTHICNLDYPKDKLQIQILDDSDDDTTGLILKLVDIYKNQKYNINLIRRDTRLGFKAGALQYGMNTVYGDFIVIFDADFLPDPDYLIKSLGFFSESKTACVQSRWVFDNYKDSILTRISALYLNGHFLIEQTARYNSNFFLNFNGTAGMWRHSVIKDCGGWHIDNLAEDNDLSYRAQLMGYKILYTNEITVNSILPDTFSALKNQQFRWSKGMMQVARKLLPEIIKSKISIYQKLESVIHLSGNIVFPIMLLAVIINPVYLIIINSKSSNFEFLNLNPIFTVFACATIFPLIFYLTAFIRSNNKNNAKNYISFILDFIGLIILFIGISINNTLAVIVSLKKQTGEFVRTPKNSPVSNNSVSNNLVSNNFSNIKFSHINYKTSKNRITSLIKILEILLFFYSVIGVILIIINEEYAAVPFQMLIAYGFGIFSYNSLREK